MSNFLYEFDYDLNIVGRMTIESPDEPIEFWKEKMYRLFPTGSQAENAPYIDLFLVNDKEPYAFLHFCNDATTKQAEKFAEEIRTKELVDKLADRWGHISIAWDPPLEPDGLVYVFAYGDPEDTFLKIPCDSAMTYKNLIDDFNFIRGYFELTNPDRKLN